MCEEEWRGLPWPGGGLLRVYPHRRGTPTHRPHNSATNAGPRNGASQTSRTTPGHPRAPPAGGPTHRLRDSPANGIKTEPRTQPQGRPVALGSRRPCRLLASRTYSHTACETSAPTASSTASCTRGGTGRGTASRQESAPCHVPLSNIRSCRTRDLVGTSCIQ